MIYNIDITTISTYIVKIELKVSGSVIITAYHNRFFSRVSSITTQNYIEVELNNGNKWLLTYDTTSTIDEVFIVDTIDTVAPTSNLDLALKIANLIRY